jgi:hypothetical protein
MLRRALIGLLLVVAAVAVLAAVARFHDGPLGPFPGGPMTGETVREPVTDWAPVLAGTSRLELEVNPTAPRSVTTTYILHDGALYVPSVLAARKHWPAEVMTDGRVVVRVHGRLYERRAVRVTDPTEIRSLAREWDPKTPDDLDVGTLSTWYFRLEPRAP